MPGEKLLNGTAQLAARVEAARRNGLLGSPDTLVAESGRGGRRRRTAIDSLSGLLGVDDKETNRGLTRGEIAKVLTIAAAAGVGAGIADIFMIITQLHRADTHRSIKPHSLFTKLVDLSQRSLGVSNRLEWADVHLDHHGEADVNLFPMLRVMRAVEWVEAEQKEGRLQDVKIPDSFRHVDPRVDYGEYPREDVMEIGRLAEERVRRRMGDLYQRPETYTREEIQDILYPTEFTHFYAKYKKKKHPEEYTSDDLAHILLRDPHSPIYAERKITDKKGITKFISGVRQIVRWGYFPYKTHIDAREAVPEITSPHLQRPEGYKPKSVVPAVVGAIAIPALVTFLARGGRHGPKDIALAVAAGVVANAARIGTEVPAAMTVNGLGHAGDELTPRRIIDAIIQPNFFPRLNDDGTVAADTTQAGWLGKWLARVTADESGLQKQHHDDPSLVNYSGKTGLEGWKEAPVGSLIEFIVDSSFPLFEPGDNFDGILQPGEIRPDLPHEATRIVERRRKIQAWTEKQRGVFEPLR